MSQPVRMRHKGKVNAELAKNVIRSTPTTGSIDLNAELGHTSSIGMPSSKTVNFGSKIENPKRR